MIAVDTSALMAILLDEPAAGACVAAIADTDRILISSGTAAEALIVAAHRHILVEMRRLLTETGFEFVPVTETSALRISEAYLNWGKGYHPAALNLGDRFSYVVAKEFGCGLLYIGYDFGKTDIEGVL